ncbi:MAG: TonB-dependent receptor plug domain-containing protein [Bacteroidota bacterium]
MRKKILLSCAILGTSVVAYTQDSLRTTTLHEVVISATRAEQSVLETPRSVTVINRDAIEKSVYNSVGELLGARNGMYIVGASQTPGTNQSLFMRGANSNQVVVMIDGVRITDPSAPNAAIDLSELSLTNVERIEVIRGSHSTIYGGAAIGGVVNIITRKNSSAGFHGNAGAQAGAFGNDAFSFTENIDLNYSLENGVYANGSFLQQNVNGLDASIKKEGLPFTTADKDEFRKSDGFIKAGFSNAEWDAFVSYKKVDQRAAIDKGANSDDENNYLDFDRDLVDYKLGYQFNANWGASVIGSWSKSLRVNENDSSLVDANGNYDKSYFIGKYHGRLQTHELQANYQNEKFKAVAGLGLYAEKMNFNTRYVYNDPNLGFEFKTNYDTLDTSAKTGYLFGQLNYSLDKLNLSAGTRLSHHQLAGNCWTFEFNPSYQTAMALFYGSLSTGFNAPSLYQLYDPSKGFGAVTARGNKNLEPEKSVSLEVGVKKEFSSGHYFTVSAYQTTVKNSIEYIYLWNGSKSIDQLGFGDSRGDTYMNIAKQVVQGVELDGHVSIGNNVFVNANISWLTGEVTVNANDISAEQTGGNHVQLYNFGTFLTGEFSDDDLTRRPSITTFVQAGFNPIDALTITAAYRHVGSRFDVGYDYTLGPYGALKQFEVDAYDLVDLGVNWQATKMFSIAFKLENVLDENYSEIAGFQTRGRSAYLKLGFRW